MIENKLYWPIGTVKWKRAVLYFTLCLAMLNVTACDYVFKNFYHLPTTKTAERPPSSLDAATIEPASGGTKEAIAVTSQKPTISIEKVREAAIHLKKDTAEFAIDPIQINTEVLQKNNEVTNTPKGLKTPKLATVENLPSQERFKKLELRVQKISEALNKMSPAITRLIGIENELDALTFQLESLLNQGKLDHLAQNKQSNTPQTTKNNIKKKSDTAAKHISNIAPAAGIPSQVIPETQQNITIYKMRSGDHNGKTRLVFETDRKIIPNISIDNNEKLLMVDFGLSSVKSDIRRMTKSSGMLKTATVIQNPQSNHISLAYDLKSKTSILGRQYIAPDQNIKNHRYVIDIKR